MENHIIPVDSLFRNHSEFENSNSFTYYLSDSLKDISYVRISSMELPPIYPSFNRELGNANFEVAVDGGGTFVTEEVAAPEIKYTATTDLATQLDTIFGGLGLGLTGTSISIVNDNGVDKIKIEANENFSLDFSTDNHPYTYQMKETVKTGVSKKDLKNYKLGGNLYYDDVNELLYRYKIVSLDTLNTQATTFLTDSVLSTSILTDHNSNLGKNQKNFNIKIPPLGYYLGFRKKFYSGSNVYISEASPILNVSDYLFVKVNNYGRMPTNHGDSEYLAKIVIEDVEKKTFDNESNVLSKRYVLSKPEDVTELRISLHDAFGNLVDMNYQDYSMTVEMGVITNSGLKGKFMESFP